MKIAIFGGTGDLGRGLAINFAAAGHEIVVGSRSQERADQAAEVAGWLTPVPGGVGPMTIAYLLSNTLDAARRRAGESTHTGDE